MSDDIKRRMLDIARAAQRSGNARCSRFLEPPSLILAKQAAHEAGVSFFAFGGYLDAERQVAGFASVDDFPDYEWPIACLRIRWQDKYSSVSHRDLLGALMALGLDRAMLGDIVMGEGCAYLFALDEVVDYLRANFESAGRASIKIDQIPIDKAQIAAPKGREIRVTLASMRLDALVAEGYKLSRADAQLLIKRGLVKLNHIELDKTDRQVSEGDLVSVRGHGRLKIIEEQGETKKGRCGVLLFIYENSR